MPSSGDLLDANVWLALAAEAHVHHRRVTAYWDSEAGPQLVFCRITQLALLRHLTNRSIMGAQVLRPVEAWQACSNFLALREVNLMPEPAALNDQLGRYCDLGRTSPNLWTDAYLAAFANCAALRLVTFDTGFSKFNGLNVLVLEP